MHLKSVNQNAAVSDQTVMATEILERLRRPVGDLLPGRYLTHHQAERIVDQTIQEVQRSGNCSEAAYLRTHRRRLTMSLTLIPFASRSGAECLDIGCFGYMSLWAERHLGYRVTGIEWRPDSAEPHGLRRLCLGDDSIDLVVHNFDISGPDWPLAGDYDTILFFETLEHTCVDPVGIMENIGRLMSSFSTLVMSVPNAVSYKTLNEFLAGNPPWVYWFFHPDIKHEPRHCFEYTPFILHYLLRAAGFKEVGSQSIVAYAEPRDLQDVSVVASDLSIDPRWFGDTLLTQARKISDIPPIRYPSCIYDADEYYELIYPVVQPVLRKALENYQNVRRQSYAAASATATKKYQALCEDLSVVVRRYESNLAEAGARLADERLAHENDRRALEQERDAALGAVAKAEARLAEERLDRDRDRGSLEQERDAALSAVTKAQARLANESLAREKERHALEAQRDGALAISAQAEARLADERLAHERYRQSFEEERQWARNTLSDRENGIVNAIAQRNRLHSQIAELRNERDFLAGQLIRTYERPWRPVKHRVNSLLLSMLAAAVTPVSRRSAARFQRSAQKRSPSRFEPFRQDGGLSSDAQKRRQNGSLNILYFSPFPSHPENHGNKSRILHFGKRFQSLGHKVHFAVLESPIFDSGSIRAMRGTWDTFDILSNAKRPWGNGSEIPFDDWYQEGLGEDVRILCDIYDVDVLFCSYVFQSKILEYAALHVLKVIDTHDKMGDRNDMLRRYGLPFDFFSCTPEEEGAYLRRADVVVAVREEEAVYFNSVTGRESAIVIPHVELPKYILRTINRLENVGLVASANRINLMITTDFLEAVLKICGSNCPFVVHIAGEVKHLTGELSPERARVFNMPWVQMHGFIQDIEFFYSHVDAVVSPATLGTGVNIKTAQAMAYGMPVVATKWGSRGIETDELMHNYADIESLVYGLLSLAEHPENLNRLAAVSRARYDKFLADAICGIESMFQHPKLSAGRGALLHSN